ncbi:MAG: ATP-dependent helicase, partial [Bacteroidetes bacterium]|nr:ATP-dependent helicase [Bacteroidota bacterium]
RIIECLSVVDFVHRFELNQTLYTENITPDELKKLAAHLPEVVSYARVNHMKTMQEDLQNLMLDKGVKYEAHLNDWKSASLEQLELDFKDRSVSHFWRAQKEKQRKEIQTIADSSSQYMKDLTSLDQEAYIKVMAVFFNE